MTSLNPGACARDRTDARLCAGPDLLRLPSSDPATAKRAPAGAEGHDVRKFLRLTYSAATPTGIN